MKLKTKQKPGINDNSGLTLKVCLVIALISFIALQEGTAKHNIFQQSAGLLCELVENLKYTGQHPATPPSPAHPPAVDDRVFGVVEQPPSFPGGEEALIHFLRENLRFPKQAMLDGIQGTVFVSFIVERDGSISNVRVLRGLSEAIDAEAIRVTESMPRWIPGTQRGQAKRVQFNIPIKFAIN